MCEWKLGRLNGRSKPCCTAMLPAFNAATVEMWPDRLNRLKAKLLLRNCQISYSAVTDRTQALVASLGLIPTLMATGFGDPSLEVSRL